MYRSFGSEPKPDKSFLSGKSFMKSSYKQQGLFEQYIIV